MSAHAVIATRCDHGPNEMRATPSSVSCAWCSEPGTAMRLTLRRPMPSTSRVDVGRVVELAGHEHAGRAGVEERATALDRVGHHGLAVAVAGAQERVGARVERERHALRVAPP